MRAHVAVMAHGTWPNVPVINQEFDQFHEPCVWNPDCSAVFVSEKEISLERVKVKRANPIEKFGGQDIMFLLYTVLKVEALNRCATNKCLHSTL